MITTTSTMFDIYVRFPESSQAPNSKYKNWVKLGPTTGGIDKIIQYRRNCPTKTMFKVKSFCNEDLFDFPVYELKLVHPRENDEIFLVKLISINSHFSEKEAETHEILFENLCR